MTTPMENLAYANEIRIERAQLRRRIASGELSMAEVIEDPPAALRKARVSYVLRSIPYVGETRARVICRTAGVSPEAHLHELTSHQRLGLVETLERRNEAA